jgi:hypothetical protein
VGHLAHSEDPTRAPRTIGSQCGHIVALTAPAVEDGVGLSNDAMVDQDLDQL